MAKNFARYLKTIKVLCEKLPSVLMQADFSHYAFTLRWITEHGGWMIQHFIEQWYSVNVGWTVGLFVYHFEVA